MMLHTLLILSSVVLATTDNNIRNEITPGVVDGGYYNGGMSVVETTHTKHISQPQDFWDKVIQFFDIPHAVNDIKLTIAIGTLMLFYAAALIVVCFLCAKWKMKDASAITGFVCIEAVLLILALYAAAATVYIKRRS